MYRFDELTSAVAKADPYIVQMLASTFILSEANKRKMNTGKGTHDVGANKVIDDYIELLNKFQNLGVAEVK